MNLGDDVDALVADAVDDFVTAGDVYKENAESIVNRYTVVREGLSKTEAITGVLGTLVWGFGDLLFKIFRC